MKCYILFGDTGEYDERREWVVSVFLSKQTAIKTRDKLNNILADHNLLLYSEIPFLYSEEKERLCKALIKDIDDNFVVDCGTGTRYEIQTSEIIDWEKK